MSMFRKRRREVPGLNTSSLPDLIFSVLFFFMIVTHMREVTLKVKYRVPEGKELARLAKKSSVIHIYIGSPLPEYRGKGKAVEYRGQGQSAENPTKGQSAETMIQINDKFVSLADVAQCVLAEKRLMSPEDQQQMTVSLKADRHTPMGVIMDVKQALRQAHVYRVNYSATDLKTPAGKGR